MQYTPFTGIGHRCVLQPTCYGYWFAIEKLWEWRTCKPGATGVRWDSYFSIDIFQTLLCTLLFLSSLIYCVIKMHLKCYRQICNCRLTTWHITNIVIMLSSGMPLNQFCCLITYPCTYTFCFVLNCFGYLSLTCLLIRHFVFSLHYCGVHCLASIFILHNIYFILYSDCYLIKCESPTFKKCEITMIEELFINYLRHILKE